MSGWTKTGTKRPPLAKWRKPRTDQWAEVLAALVRALRRKGTELATERDLLIDGIDPLEDGAARLIQILTATQAQNKALVTQVENCRHFRHKLITKIRELQKQLAAVRPQPPTTVD